MAAYCKVWRLAVGLLRMLLQYSGFGGKKSPATINPCLIKRSLGLLLSLKEEEYVVDVEMILLFLIGLCFFVIT